MLLLPLALIANIVSVFSLWATSNSTTFNVVLTFLIAVKFICYAAGALIGKKRIGRIFIIACASLGIISLIACMVMKVPMTGALTGLLTIALMIWIMVTKYFSESVEKKV